MANEIEQTETNSIYEERTEEIIHSHQNGKSTTKTARFLKPFAKETDQAVKIPNTPLLSEIFSSHQALQQWPPPPSSSKVHFKGWNYPQKNWKQWVDKLAVKYGVIWKQTGICDAIMSSTYHVRRNRDVVLGLSEFWCSETSSFVFPWGEVTITLEDAMILGGLPVLGEPVTCPLSKKLFVIEDKLNQKRLELSRNRSKKATHSGWMNLFMERDSDDELEHVAFLSLWLSRYVFPSLVVEQRVIKIAIHLSKGTPMALASAVLASVYKSLRSLKEEAIKSSDTIVVSGSLQLVQLWAFEHFPLLLLGPKSPNCLQPEEPRIARWQKLWSKITLPHVRSVVKLAENFQWRPYAANLKNWRHLSYYKETEQFIYNCLSLDEELQSFVQCLCGCELVGFESDDKEKYFPNRVAMQFGYDQDLPSDIFGFENDFVCINLGFFVPKRDFEPGVSVRYFDWWKESKLAREEVVLPLVQAITTKEKAEENSDTPKHDSGMMEEDPNYENILEFPIVVSNRAYMISNGSQAMQAEEKEDPCDTIVASKRFSNKLIGHSDEDDDEISIAAWFEMHDDVSANRTSPRKAYSPCNRFQKVGSSISDDADETNTTRKRKLFTTREDSREIANGKAAAAYGVAKEAKSKAAADGVAEEVESNVAAADVVAEEVESMATAAAADDDDSANDRKERVLKKVKKVSNFYVSNVSENIEKKGKFSKTSVIKGKTKGEKNMAGKSTDNPIDLDDDIHTG